MASLRFEMSEWVASTRQAASIEHLMGSFIEATSVSGGKVSIVLNLAAPPNSGPNRIYCTALVAI